MGKTASGYIDIETVQALSSHLRINKKKTRSIPFACGIFESNNTKKHIIVISLHGSHGGWSISNVTQHILEQISGGVNIPVLLMGDFNIPGKKEFETSDHIFINMDENYRKETTSTASAATTKKYSFQFKGRNNYRCSGWDRKYGSRPDNIYIGNPRNRKKIEPSSHQVYRPSRDP